jgi:hypothetical protein
LEKDLPAPVKPSDDWGPSPHLRALNRNQPSKVPESRGMFFNFYKELWAPLFLETHSSLGEFIIFTFHREVIQRNISVL